MSSTPTTNSDSSLAGRGKMIAALQKLSRTYGENPIVPRGPRLKPLLDGVPPSEETTRLYELIRGDDRSTP